MNATCKGPETFSICTSYRVRKLTEPVHGHYLGLAPFFLNPPTSHPPSLSLSLFSLHSMFRIANSFSHKSFQSTLLTSLLHVYTHTEYSLYPLGSSSI